MIITPTEDKLIYMRLTDGTKILTQVRKKNGNWTTLVNPVELQQMQLQDGTFKAIVVGGLNPVAQDREGKFDEVLLTIYSENIAFETTDVSEEYATAYIAALGAFYGLPATQEGTIQ